MNVPQFGLIWTIIFSKRKILSPLASRRLTWSTSAKVTFLLKPNSIINYKWTYLFVGTGFEYKILPSFNESLRRCFVPPKPFILLLKELLLIKGEPPGWVDELLWILFMLSLCLGNDLNSANENYVLDQTSCVGLHVETFRILSQHVTPLELCHVGVQYFNSYFLIKFLLL